MSAVSAQMLFVRIQGKHESVLIIRGKRQLMSEGDGGVVTDVTDE